jgi:dihydropteroate synthase
MGVINVTPDSFSDGGLCYKSKSAIAYAKFLEEAGADIIDIGGESSRPFSQAVPIEEELGRVVPVIKALAPELRVPISIDTYKAKVARVALEAGAKIVNDISALRFDKEMAKVIADYKALVILMHMRGTPKDMQLNPFYEDVLREIYEFLARRIDFAHSQGISEGQIAIDPGIGFGKGLDDNLCLLKNINFFKGLGKPILLGPSRKAFIGQILKVEDPKQRDIGTLAVVAIATWLGVNIIRVHALHEARQVIDMAKAIMNVREENCG